MMMTTALVTALLLAQPAPAAKPAPPAPPALPAPKASPAPPAPPAATEGDSREQPVLSGFDAPTGKKFTGEFKDRPIGEALREVARAGGFSIVLPSGLFGTVNADFQAAPVEDVLRVLLAQNDLRARREGTILTVSRATSGSLVIRGGKRRVQFGSGQEGFRVQVDDDEIRREAKEAAREAEREARELEREARATEREARREEREAREGDGNGGRGSRVITGDHVVEPGEHVSDLVVLRGNVRLQPGSSAGQVTAVMGSIDVGPGVHVDGEVVAVGGDVHVGPGAYVGGNVVSVGGKLVLEQGARIDGQQTAVDVPGLARLFALAGSRPFTARETPPVIRAGQAVAQFAALFALGLLLLVITPRRVEAVGRSVENSPGKALLTGFLGTLALPILALLLIVTVVGIPLVPVLVLAVVAATILGFTALALRIGDRLPLGTRGQVLRLAIGTALLVVAMKIPFLGLLVAFSIWLFTFGAVIRTRFGQMPALADAPLPPPFPPPPVSSPPPPPPSPPAPPPPPAASAP